MYPFSRQQVYSGFTLLEVIVVLGVLAIVSTAVMPFAINTIASDTVQQTALDLESAIFQQQQYARTGKDGEAWGVLIESDKYTLFQGEDVSSDPDPLTIQLSSEVTLVTTSGFDSGQDIVFMQNEFAPTGEQTLNVVGEQVTYQIKIYPTGLIDVYKL